MTERDRIELTEELTPAQLAALSRLLADPKVWEDPDPRVEDAVVAAITAEAALAGPRLSDEIEVVPARRPARTPCTAVPVSTSRTLSPWRR